MNEKEMLKMFKFYKMHIQFNMKLIKKRKNKNISQNS